MAIFGLNTAGQALTATTAADTILYFGATASARNVTVQAGDGNDVIWLGPQGFTASNTGTVTWSTSLTGGTGSTYSAGLAGQDVSYQTAVTLTTGAAATGVALTGIVVSGVVTSQIGARALVSSQLWGNAGNDSIYLAPAYIASQTSVPGLTRVNDVTIGGGAGDDVIGTVTFVNNTAVTASAATGILVDSAFIEGGGGNDTITFIANSAEITGTTIQGSQGDDHVRVANALGTFKNSQILAGGGNDLMSGVTLSAFDTSTLAAGGGNDTISFTAGGGDASLVSLDTFNTQSDYDGNDLLTASFTGNAGTASGITIQAGGGNDSIHLTVSAADSQDNLIQLNAGDDLLSATRISATTIEAGAGNDTISLDSGGLLTSFIQMGGGNDVFDFGGSGAGVISGVSGSTIFGGAGADNFTASAQVTNTRQTIGVQFGYSAATDSVLSAYDTIQITNTGGTYNFRYLPGGANTTSMSAAAFTATDGSLQFTGTVASDITARVEAVSEAGVSTGSTFTFVDGSNRHFLFVSGGDSTVTTDDLLVQVGTGGVASGGSINAISASVGISLIVGID